MRRDGMTWNPMYAWWAARGIVSAAATLTAGWSLYAVARHYDAPKGIAGAAVAVFDGIAFMCLHLASEAAAEGRSAVGARATTLFMAAVSIYLNHTHADLIHGGRPAFALFAVPTVGLLAVSEMAWAGPRARARAQRGEQPYRLPAFGGWAWLLAPKLASRTVQARAVAHIQACAPPPTPAREMPALDTDKPEITVARVRDVSGHDPGALPPAEPDMALTGPDMLSGQRPGTIAEAVRGLIAQGVTDPKDAVTHTVRLLGPDTRPDTVRREHARQMKRLSATPDKPGQGGGGYL